MDPSRVAMPGLAPSMRVRYHAVNTRSFKRSTYSLICQGDSHAAKADSSGYDKKTKLPPRGTCTFLALRRKNLCYILLGYYKLD
jgi:hypothetical protein